MVIVLYESLTHVAVTRRMLSIGTQSGLLMVRASDFVTADDADATDRASGAREARRLLLERLAARPDGAHHLSKMDQIDDLFRRPQPCFAIWSVLGLCLLATILQLMNPLVEQVGSLIPELFVRGELWRAVSSHFLHAMPGFPVHLAMNVAGLLVLGYLVEHPLGSWRTAVVLALGALGSVVGILLYDYPEVLGSSGLVAALAGGILALELHHTEALPAQWRLSRRLFIGALLAQLVLDQVFASYLAGGAHLGGFAGGYAAVWMLEPPSIEAREATPRLRLATGAILGLLVFGLVGGVPLARRAPGALERHAQRLLDTPSEYHLAIHDNAAAWFLATDEAPSRVGLGLAVALADRAVANTGRMNPDFLDTLAEALFQAGDRFGALLTIDEAIRLVPHERYFIEQRRRFTGERDPLDRPPPPGSSPPEEGPEALPEEPLFDPEAPAILL